MIGREWGVFLAFVVQLDHAFARKEGVRGFFACCKCAWMS